MNRLIYGDCLEKMKNIDDGSIDMILCDLPYGTTANKWDSVIDLKNLWSQYKRIVKSDGAIVLTAQIPFSISLGASNLKMLKYEWIWQKDNSTGFLNSKKQPLKNHENILVFYSKQCTYNPQMTEGKPYIAKSGRASSNYNKFKKQTLTINSGERYPLSIVKFNRDKEKIHPTQKPVSLFEYLIKTYTNEGDIVLDNCAGSGTTGIACLNTNRKYILIEKDLDMFFKMKNRIQKWPS